MPAVTPTGRQAGRQTPPNTRPSLLMYCTHIIRLSAPRLPPMAAPKKGWSFTKAVDRLRKSSCTPPWMMPYRLCYGWMDGGGVCVLGECVSV